VSEQPAQPAAPTPVQESEKDIVLAALEGGALNASGVVLWLAYVTPASVARAQLVIDELVREGLVVQEHEYVYKIVAQPGTLGE